MNYTKPRGEPRFSSPGPANNPGPKPRPLHIYCLFPPPHDGNLSVVFSTSCSKFGVLPFHTRIVSEVCRLAARLKGEAVGNREYTAVCFLFCLEALTRMPVVGFWSRTVGKFTRRASRARFLSLSIQRDLRKIT